MLDVSRMDAERNIPLYQQLQDMIRSDIKTGRLTPGDRLPPVRDLAEELNVAPGTIKRAYDALEQERLVEKVQGRGTFVCYQPASSDSRKERAMAAIDHLMDQLEEMSLSPAEIRIFLNLKLREREARREDVKLAVVENTPELLTQLSEQLRGIPGVDLYTHLLSHIESYPYKLSEDMDLIVTSSEHASTLEKMIAEPKKIAKTALRLSTASVARIVKLQAGERVGVLCVSREFGRMLYETCLAYTERVTVFPPELLAKDLDYTGFLQDKTAVLLPEGYEKHVSEEAQRQLQQWKEKGSLILCAYRVDEGSLMYLQEKIERLRSREQI